MKAYVEVERCRICGNDELDDLLSLGTLAMTGIFPRTRDEEVASGPLALVKCAERPGRKSCGLVQLRQSYDKREMYGGRYGYRSSLNPSMVRHLRRRVQAACETVRLAAGDLVLDIGANDGTLLSAYPKVGADLCGIDPAADAFADRYPGDLQLIPDFFSAAAVRARFGDRRAKIITSIAMFYDLDEPQKFVEEIRDVLADDGIWVLEQSYLPTMLRRTAYDTICHEHLEYYGARQLAWMFDRAGLKVVALERNDVNGGSLALTVARTESARPAAADELAALLREEEILAGPAPYRAFAEAVQRSRDGLRAFFQRAASEGRSIVGYGASTKGNVILQYCGLDEKNIPCIGEVNSDKFGSFTPGTKIPIVPEVEARARKPDFLLVLPWHFRDGIVAKESAFTAKGGRLLFPLPVLESVPA
jgi:NDP-4-keto-2,6-dideoxyhexose 3-C-methyltransferase